jgi:hypothetical protein
MRISTYSNQNCTGEADSNEDYEIGTCRVNELFITSSNSPYKMIEIYTPTQDVVFTSSATSDTATATPIPSSTTATATSTATPNSISRVLPAPVLNVLMLAAALLF